jgi:hypothetical protein
MLENKNNFEIINSFFFFFSENFLEHPRTLMYTVWHVDKYKITFKLIISHWTNEMSFLTHSRILFSSEYFHYKIFIYEKCLEN